MTDTRVTPGPDAADADRVVTVAGGDWQTVLPAPEGARERVVVNMGPQHPSTHGVLRLILELDGESVTEARCGIGYLHTGIEKNLEFRSWVQGVTFVTRMDYLTRSSTRPPTASAWRNCWGSPTIPERATVIRVMMMELNRIASHLVCPGHRWHGTRRPHGHDVRFPRT